MPERVLAADSTRHREVNKKNGIFGRTPKGKVKEQQCGASPRGVSVDVYRGRVCGIETLVDTTTVHTALGKRWAGGGHSPPLGASKRKLHVAKQLKPRLEIPPKSDRGAGFGHLSTRGLLKVHT